MQYPNQPDPTRSLRATGCLVLTLMLLFGCLLPLLFVDVARTALTNLHLEPAAALFVLFGIVLGSLINLPVARYPLDREVIVPVFEPFAGWPMLPRYQRMRQEMIVSVNVGGCVVPVLLAIWLLRFIVAGGAVPISVLLLGMALNTSVCYYFARPVPRVGIALPFFLPALTALAATWFGLPLMSSLLAGLAPAALGEVAAPVAFVIGITGPLVGADLLHWKDFAQIGAGQVSIGGAGTWDGIVLSGLLAAFWA